MVDHDLRLVRGPSIARKRSSVLDLDEKEPLIRRNALTVRQLKHKFTPPRFGANSLHPNASLFLELADCGLFECLSLLDSTARRSPVLLACQSAYLVNEVEEQNSSHRI